MNHHTSICSFGKTPTGEPVSTITLDNGSICCKVLTYGATLHSLFVPDRNGNPVDVVLGYDSLREYVENDGYLGATVGRFANRIAKARFSLNGNEYPLAANNGPNHLHGGLTGFSHRVWAIDSCSPDTLTLSLLSKDGEEGYPGNLLVKVTYTLCDNTLTIRYHAVSDADTPCNLTNHSYFNLSGHDSGSVLDQTIQIFAQCYTPTDQESIPLGAVTPVANTPMDLRKPVRIGEHIDDDFSQLVQGHGYDHNYVVDGEDPFNDEAISADLEKYEDLRSQLENDLNQCRIEYRVHNAPNIDWSKFAEKGFDVYQNEGIYIVVLPIHSMESFADCVKEVCSAELVSNTVFRYATHAELGLPTHDIPSDDGQDIVPSDANDEPIEIPHDEQPVADDVVVE